MFEKVKIEILLLLLSMLVCMSLKIIISFLFLYFCEEEIDIFSVNKKIILVSLLMILRNDVCIYKLR